MKTILLCIITTIFLSSCSSDSDFENTEVLLRNTQRPSLTIGNPENPLNPFDLKGREIYEGLSAYYANRKSANSVSELAEQIRFVSGKLGNKQTLTGRLIPFTDEIVQSIMDDPDNSMILIVQNSSLQNYAKLNLIGFLNQLIVKRQQEFSICCNYITVYESEVLNDTSFSSEERETILTVSSISRYSLYSEEERKDKDWDILIGNKHAKSFFTTGEASIISIISLLEVILKR